MHEVSHRVFPALLAFVLVAMSVIVAVWLSPSQRRRRRALALRLEEIRLSREVRSRSPVESRQSDLPEWLATLLGARSTAALLTLHQRADAEFTPLRTLQQSLALMLAGGMLGALGSGPAVGLAAAVLAGSAPLLSLGLKARRRQQQFRRQFGPVLEFLARSMRSGLDLPAAMRMVCEEFPDPAATEFRRAVDEVKYGMAVDTAIQRIDQRVPCADLAYLSACVSIQRETGGGLAQSVATLARSIRERRVFEARIRTLSAQGRLSASILCLLPIGMLGIMSLTNRSYIGVLLDTPTGNQLLWGALGLTAAGVSWVVTLVRVRF